MAHKWIMCSFSVHQLDLYRRSSCHLYHDDDDDALMRVCKIVWKQIERDLLVEVELVGWLTAIYKHFYYCYYYDTNEIKYYSPNESLLLLPIVWAGDAAASSRVSTKSQSEIDDWLSQGRLQTMHGKAVQSVEGVISLLLECFGFETAPEARERQWPAIVVSEDYEVKDGQTME